VSSLSDYKRIFEQRGHLYNRAVQKQPLARAVERRLLLERARLEPGLRVLDAPAGGGYVASGIHEQFADALTVICVEPSARFASDIDARFERLVCTLERMSLPDGSFDRVLSLSGLHHLPDKAPFVHEAARLLKPGGLLVAADVLCDTQVAHFLNGPVDRLSETGHDGRFLAPGELTELFRNAGLTPLSEELCRYAWSFPDEPTLVAYCKELFGLTRAEDHEIQSELRRYLEIAVTDGRADLHWCLEYGVAVKPR
jgi:SAM-dependent methyltransferase